MLIQVLLICLDAFVQANIKDDIGAIPYENPATRAASPGMPAIPDSDYGNIPYEKASSKSDDYGNVPYEEVASKPRVNVDYGNIPYERVVGLTPRGENGSMDIPGILQDIFKGRDVPGLTYKTRAETANVSDLTAATTTIETTKTTDLLTTLTVKLRAKEGGEPDDFIDVYIDDSHCKKSNCTTCKDKSGYRVYCKKGVTTPAPTDLGVLLWVLSDVAAAYWSNGDLLWRRSFNKSIAKGYPQHWPICPTTTSTTDTPSPTWPPHNLTGQTIAKCFVCGMYEGGIPDEDHVCSDSFLSHSYRKHCKFLDRDGWHVNGSGGFYMWGHWTGGCSLRYTDISTVYHQRTCRNNLAPALGSHYVSRRMAKLEFALRKEKDGCLASPTASLVPLSRGISLFSRFHVCVCSQNYCNRAERLRTVFQWSTVDFVLSMVYGVLQRKLTN